MAYGAKYFLEFSDPQGTVWRYDILKKDYIGANTNIKGSGSPAIVTWHGGELYKPIRSSEAIINIFSETNFQFSEFFTAGEEDYLLQIKRGGTLWWEGINVVETYSEPYVLPPYTIKLRFSDGLGSLKYKEYLIAEARLGLLWVITKCLDNLPFSTQKNIVEIINVLENQITENTSNWFLNSTALNQGLFKKFDTNQQKDVGWTCYDVLKEIMIANGCTIFQANNEWYIVRIEELENVTPKYVRYNGTGTILNSGTITIQKAITNTEAGITWLYQDAEMAISEIFNEIIYEYKFLPDDRIEQEIIIDDNMDSGFYTSGQANKFPYWQFVGITKGTEIIKTVFQKYNIPFTPGNINFLAMNFTGFFASGLKTSTPVLDLSKYIKPVFDFNGSTITKKLITTTSDTSSLHLSGIINLNINHTADVEPTLNQYNTIYVLDFYFSISIGTYYLQEVAGVLSWVVDNTKTIRIRKEFPVYSFYRKDPYSSRSETFYELDEFISLPGFPENTEDDLTIIMYAPVNPKYEIDSNHYIVMKNLYLSNFNFIFYPANSTVNTNKVVLINNISGIRKNKKNVEVKLSDERFVFVDSCYRVLPVGVFQYVKAEDWHIRGSVDLFDAAEIFILRPYSKFYGKYRQEIKATLYGNNTFEFFNILTTDGKTFMQDGLSYDLKKGEKNIQLLQISALTYVPDVFNWDFGITIIPFPPTVFVEDVVISKQEAVKKLMQNNENANISNINIAVKTAAIKEINGKTGTNTDYTSYPS